MALLVYFLANLHIYAYFYYLTYMPVNVSFTSYTHRKGTFAFLTYEVFTTFIDIGFYPFIINLQL